jgi:hypothetical protein
MRRMGFPVPQTALQTLAPDWLESEVGAGGDPLADFSVCRAPRFFTSQSQRKPCATPRVGVHPIDEVRL